AFLSDSSQVLLLWCRYSFLVIASVVDIGAIDGISLLVPFDHLAKSIRVWVVLWFLK
ncbi:19804_t:CDS:2, partial [Gigaspora rosea]